MPRQVKNFSKSISLPEKSYSMIKMIIRNHIKQKMTNIFKNSIDFLDIRSYYQILGYLNATQRKPGIPEKFPLFIYAFYILKIYDL